MAIPVPGLYLDENLGAGAVADISHSEVNTNVSQKEIGFGVAVSLTDDNKIVPATSLPIYGITIRRSYLEGDHLTVESLANDKWQVGEAVGVLVDGTVAVQISEDVSAGDYATVGEDGVFKRAEAGQPTVGLFKTSGESGKTASLQYRMQFSTAPTAPSANNSSSSGSNNSSSSNSSSAGTKSSK